MHPFEKQSSDLPEGVAPHLDVRLKPGWRFDRRRRALVADAGQTVSLRRLLPAAAKIVPMAASLAESTSRTLSEDERLLARYYQIVLPPDADPAKMAANLHDIAGLDLVSIPPRIGLP